MDFLADFKDRELFAQSIHEEELVDHLQSPRVGYIGFDPTAPSLHAGSLIQILNLKRWQMAGHKAIALIGGGTGYIGDPSGKTQLRNMMNLETIQSNAEGIRNQLGNILDLSDAAKGEVVNNIDWLRGLNYLDFLREFGVHFSVNKMLTADCYKARLETGLSFLEFNYMLLQSYDFWHLFKNEECTVQLGGDDQWSNILGGADLIRRFEREKAFCITSQLLLTSDGKKMGKTESGAVWLDPDLTSPHDFFQYWRNVADSDVISCLKLLTFVPMDEVRSMENEEGSALNKIKEKLAYEVTQIVHGEEEAKRCLERASNLFNKSGGGDDAPEISLSAGDIGEGILVTELMPLAGITKSKGEARRLVEGGGVSINGEKVGSIEDIVNLALLQAENGLLLKKGKKKFWKLRAD